MIPLVGGQDGFINKEIFSLIIIHIDEMETFCPRRGYFETPTQVWQSVDACINAVIKRGIGGH